MLICNLEIKGAGEIDRCGVIKGSVPSKLEIKVAFGISFPFIIIFLLLPLVIAKCAW